MAEQQLNKKQASRLLGFFDQGILTLSSTGTQTINCGFEPKTIEFTYVTINTNVALGSHGWWTDGDNLAFTHVQVGSLRARGRADSHSMYIVNTGGNTDLTARVSSTSSTGFVVHCTNHPGWDADFMWRAMG